ncbi:3-oxoacyl-[acyl-carrier-protein] synthase 3 [Candidatus Fokinia solitaria]|uniref:3-oxoacyl-[acyl-carrier-protein] synthase 3 n=1 Tax=Candidatus Fokinia solitaria TaxID=1802984 RepID=A0A2U8BSC1_9RICK|nr:beta-ketoacyl-ACP synthase 3 [Candidatus Fokinia solitaria]AWD33198.1 3-oxoacyl-[acyl-carrier-protein] synthase 3 [Candidatus Fokinia solitaria]
MLLSILNVSSYIPAKCVTNADIVATIDSNDEWITSRTGITQRYIADGESETTTLMSYNACKRVFESTTTISPSDIDCIVVATTTQDSSFPSTANMLQNKLDIKNGKCFSFDLQAACSGFTYGLHVINGLHTLHKQSSSAPFRALLVGVDTMSKLVDWSDRNTCILFGDGASAVLLSDNADDFSDIGENAGIVKTDIVTEAEGVSSLFVDPPLGSGKLHMNGRDVFKKAINGMVQMANSLAKKTSIALTDIDLFIPHQANIRIIHNVADILRVDTDKFMTTIQKHANTSAASIPLALEEAVKSQKLRRGNTVMLLSAGAGMTFGGAILKY